MRIIICFFLVMTLAVSFGIWKLSENTHLLNNQISRAKGEISTIKLESKDLSWYKDEPGLSLDKFYLEVFNALKEICSYYNADSEIKIIEGKDFVNTQEFFKASQYKGISYVDILCRVAFKETLDTYLFNTLCKMTKTKPIEILEVRLEKNTLVLTMRLYGL